MWGFLAQDMVAMWLPRVWTSLQEGKKPYDPMQDPQTKDKPFNEQVKAWVSGNCKGLNWVNFFEGTKREIATGPGLLAVPALAFMLNRAMANPATELSAPAIEGLGLGLKTHLTEHLKGKTYAKGQKEEFIKDAQTYLKKVFADTEFSKKHAASISEWIESEVKSSVEHAQKPGLERLASNAKHAFNREKDPASVTASRQKLDRDIWWFNREERINEYHLEHGVIRDTKPLNNRGKAWVSYQPDALEKAKSKAASSSEGVAKEGLADAKKLVSQINFAQVQNDVSRVGGYLNKVWDNFEKAGHTNIAEATEKTMKELTRNKWLFGGGVTVLTAAYLVKLAFWAQNHGTYQATRLLTEDAAKKNNNAVSGRTPNHPFSPQAGLPFGSQPAFSRFANQVPVRPPSSLSGNGLMQPLASQAAQLPFGSSVPAPHPLFQGKRAEGGQA